MEGEAHSLQSYNFELVADLLLLGMEDVEVQGLYKSLVSRNYQDKMSMR